MKGKLISLFGIGIGMLTICGILGIKELRERNKKTENEISLLYTWYNKKCEEENTLIQEIKDYHSKIDEQIRETEQLIQRIKEDFGLDPKELDIQIDPV